jgi:hypothetical protein
MRPVRFLCDHDFCALDSSISQGGPSNLDELFQAWRQIFGTMVNIKVGKFEPNLGLLKMNDNGIATSFATFAFKVGDPQSARNPPRMPLQPMQ